MGSIGGSVPQQCRRDYQGVFSGGQRFFFWGGDRLIDVSGAAASSQPPPPNLSPHGVSLGRRKSLHSIATVQSEHVASSLDTLDVGHPFLHCYIARWLLIHSVFSKTSLVSLRRTNPQTRTGTLYETDGPTDIRSTSAGGIPS